MQRTGCTVHSAWSRTSTLIIGVVVVALVLLALGTFAVDLLRPRFRFLSYLPALVFMTTYIEVFRRKAARASRGHQHGPAHDD